MLSRRFWLLVILGSLLFLFPAELFTVSAQIMPIGESDFSDQAVRLPVVRLVRGSPAAEALTVYGVRFSGAASVPIVESVTISQVIPPEFDAVIRNDPLEGTSAGKPLVMRFQDPLRRIGFTLSNGASDTVATIRALTRQGELLGSLEIEEVQELRGPFVGFETSHPDGISTVLVDYGQAPNPEQMTGIRFDYLESQTYRIWFAQVAAGRAGDRRLSTLLQLQTLLPSRAGEVAAVLRSFDSGGAPMPINIGGEEDDTFELNLPFSTSRRLSIQPPDGGTVLGYASVEADAPIAGQIIYGVSGVSSSVLAESTPLTDGSEAGVAGAEARTVHVFPVQIDRAGGRNTGIAIANTSDAENIVRVRIFDETGTRPDAIMNQPILALGPREHRAFFLSELCRQTVPPQEIFCERDFLAEQDFAGSLEIAGESPLAITILRTRGGVPVSSLPVGSTQR